jgi:serine/threonine protein kinase
MTVELSPSSTFAGYRVDRLIGRGGMGAVYAATRVSDGAPVALKLVLSEHASNARFLRRFEREGRLASTLQHPNLVRVLEARREGDVAFLAMDFVEGIDLHGALAEFGPLHPVTAAGIAAQVASALDAAHAEGLVHRDVKPGNVLLERREQGPHAYLTDFGLSRHADSKSGITGTGQWVGTVSYAAPEQVQAAEVDGRTDVYALGCVLHEMLTGEVPYPRDREVDKLIAHVTEPPPRVTDRGAGVPEAFDAVVSTAMAKSPEERFQTAGELGQAARDAAREAGPEPPDPIPFPSAQPGVDSDAPTAG